jgi:hypothetical protein
MAILSPNRIQSLSDGIPKAGFLRVAVLTASARATGYGGEGSFRYDSRRNVTPVCLGSASARNGQINCGEDSRCLKDGLDDCVDACDNLSHGDKDGVEGCLSQPECVSALRLAARDRRRLRPTVEDNIAHCCKFGHSHNTPTRNICRPPGSTIRSLRRCNRSHSWSSRPRHRQNKSLYRWRGSPVLTTLETVLGLRKGVVSR